jgi:DNA-binding transcriptional ArsR family regulator
VAEPTGLDLLFRALGDPTRRGMVERLAKGPASVKELAEPYGISLPTALQHLGVLTDAGIVTSQKVGRTRSFSLVPDAFAAGRRWMDNHRLHAERQLDALVHHLDADQGDHHEPR